jgi:NAD(P)-dependent dehydrogenase (short-subunit alcohol dehydrogenase family)
MELLSREGDRPDPCPADRAGDHVTQFDNQVAVVAGATGELGAAICERLAAEHAVVVLLGREEEALREVAGRVDPSGQRAYVRSCDLHDSAATSAVVEEIAQAFGSIDILATAAGSTRRVHAYDATDEDFADAMANKFLINVRLVTSVAAVMRRQRRGRMVVVSGVGGIQPMDVHLPGGSANAALSLFAKGYARLLARDGVALNVVNPGAVTSPRLLGHHAARAEALGLSVEEAREHLLSEIPLRREGLVSEIADVVVFLASPQAGFIVGESVNVDGGQVAGL